MDLMFLNATTRADHFPPKDPWLSGHTVAYYYFGYLHRRDDWAARRRPHRDRLQHRPRHDRRDGARRRGGHRLQPRARCASPRDRRPAHAPKRRATPSRASRRSTGRAAGCSACAGRRSMLVVMGNLVWVFQFVSAYGIGGQGFYDWLDVSGLKARRTAGTAWYPSDFFAFFDASRIYPLDDAGLPRDHRVPDVQLPARRPAPARDGAAVRAARRRPRADAVPQPRAARRHVLAAAARALVAAAILVGGLAFLNTWDIATMAFVVVAAAFVSNFTRVRAHHRRPLRAGAHRSRCRC